MIGVEVGWANTRDAIVSLAAILAALALIWRTAVRPVISFGKRVERVMESVEEQLYPNGGASLRDAVSEIQEALGIQPKLPKTNPPESRRQETP